MMVKLGNLYLVEFSGSIVLLRITGTTGSSYRSDIALDNISLTGTKTSPEPIYTTWSKRTFGKTFTDTHSGSNQDNDSLTNLQEFAFGTDPTLHSDLPLSPDGLRLGVPLPVTTDGGVSYDLYFVRRKDYATAGSITYTPQFSGNLSSFAATNEIPTVVVADTVDPDYEIVKVAFPVDKTFGRVKVSITPELME